MGGSQRPSKDKRKEKPHPHPNTIMATQTFDFLCILDFEASCDTKEQMSRADMEIIEFPSVLIHTQTSTIVDDFQQYVKLRKFKSVSEFCTQLTGISQQTLDAQGVSFPTALQLHVDWLAKHGIPEKHSCLLVTCGDWDLKTMLPAQCRDYGLPVPPIYSQWTNIKFPYSTVTKKPPVGMAGMLKVLRLPLKGRHHSGIDDCKNIASIALCLLERSVVFLPTGTNLPTGSYQRLDAFPPPPSRRGQFNKRQ